MNQDVCYKRNDVNLNPVAFCDADWSADPKYNWLLFLSETGPVISWKSKK